MGHSSRKWHIRLDRRAAYDKLRAARKKAAVDAVENGKKRKVCDLAATADMADAALRRAARFGESNSTDSPAQPRDLTVDLRSPGTTNPAATSPAPAAAEAVGVQAAGGAVGGTNLATPTGAQFPDAAAAAVAAATAASAAAVAASSAAAIAAAGPAPGAAQAQATAAPHTTPPTITNNTLLAAVMQFGK